MGDGLDDGVFGTSRITEHATVRIDIPLPSRVRLANDSAATSVSLLRGTPTTQNTPSLQPVFMYDGRDLTLEAQALGAVHAHAQNGVEPTPLQLELIAEFQRTAPRFFSSLPLFLFARGGPPPRLPNGVTASEKRGRAMFDDVPITPGSTRGLCAMCHSGPMLDVSNEFNIFLPDLPGLRFFGVGVSERNKLNLPTHEFIIDGTDRIVTPDPGACLTDPPDPNEFPPELFGPGGPFRSSSPATCSRRRRCGESGTQRPTSTTTRRKRCKKSRSNIRSCSCYSPASPHATGRNRHRRVPEAAVTQGR